MIRLGLRTLVLGATAGFAAFLLDLLLALGALGYWLPLRPHHPLAVVAVGVLVASSLQLAGWGVGRLTTSGGGPWCLADRDLLAWTLALLYVPAIYERIHQAVAFRISSRAALWAGLAAVAAYGLWALMLTRTARSSGSRLSWGPLLAAWTAALGLAINRTLVDRPTDPEALAADAAVVAGAWIVARLTRRWGWRPVVAAGVAVLVAGLSLHVEVGFRAGSGARSATPEAPSSPSLFLVVIDTLRQDVFRQVLETTEEGRRFHASLAGTAWFDNAIAAAPWTAPSVGSIHTGLYPVEHGFGSRALRSTHQLPRLDRSVLTLAQFLNNRGYQTAGLVTNALLHPDSGIARGFQSYEVLQAATHKLPILHSLVQAGWISHQLYQPAPIARRYLQHRMSTDGAGDRHRGAWIDTESPYFVWLHLMDPHAPLHPHPELPPDPGADDLPEMDRLYREETRFALRELAILFEDLARESPGWDRTLVVVASDHGEMFPSDDHFSGVYEDGEPKVSGHGHAFYDELVRIPLGIRPPGGLGEARRIDAVVSHVDLFTTLVDLLGLEAPARQAVHPSFASWLAPGPQQTAGRDVALSSMNQHGAPNRSLRSRTRKLIHYPGGERPDELYDLVTDPRERRNLAPRHPEEVAAVVALHDRMWSRLAPSATAEAVELNAETRRQLEALGYLGR